MAINLKKMRKNLKEKKVTNNQDESIYPFWDLGVDQTSTIRLLPFEDEISGGFWTIRKMLPMEFVDPQNDAKTLKYWAPCLEMYESKVKCPVANVVRGLFSEEKELKNSGQTKEAEALYQVALTHWIKYKYYYQGFINKNGIAEQSPPSNPIRIFPFTKSIHQIIEDSIMSEDDPMDFLPTGEFSEEDIQLLMSGDVPDGEEEELMQKFVGRDFILKKTRRGEHNDYSTSRWSSSTSDLTDDQIAAIHEHGFHDLRVKLPERPTEEQYDVLAEMMQVSIDYALGNGDGLWNPEWEEAGIKPIRPKNEDGGTQSSSKDSGSVKNRLKNKLKPGSGKASSKNEEENDADNNDGDGADGVRQKLGRGRGAAKKETKNEDVSEDEGDTEDEAPKKSSGKSSGKNDRIAALSARIKKRSTEAADAG